MNEPLLQPENAATFTSPSVAPADFWQSFHVFASRFDQSGFIYWYIYVLGSCAFFFIPFLLHVTHLIKIFTPRELAFYSENPWLILLIGIAVVLVVLSFNLWWSSIRKTFENLVTKQRIRLKNEHGNLDQEYRTFIDEFQADLLSRRRYIAVAISMGACLVLFWVLLIPYVSFSARLSPLLLFVTPGALILGYFLGISSWIMIMSGIRLRALTLKFMLEMEPAHPDNCGGLRFLGNFCLGLALPILVGVAFFALYGIGSTIFPMLIHNQQTIQIGAGLGLIVFDVPLAVLSFFFPLWYIHREMVASKEAFQDIFGEYISQLEKKLWTALTHTQLEEAKVIKEEIEIAQAMNPGGYPSWPFDRRILFIYLLPQILPVLSLLLPLFKG
jgi:hypothetical protein